MPKPILIVQGAQWGSEAKGAVAAKLCQTHNVEYAVRTGAINAGHTVWFGGQRYAMQQLPTGWVNPSTKLVIGPGAYIHPPTLWREIDMINAAMPDSDVRDRLYIDYRCGIHDVEAEEASAEANRHHRIGATGKGCSEAIVAKIRNRGAGYNLFVQSEAGKDFRSRNYAQFIDTVEMLHAAYDDEAQILIEGTQGTLLDMHLGPYPFTTSRMTSAANWVAEAGLAPGMQYETVLVVRTFPIRVAGNSGPMTFEMEWTELAREINSKLEADGLAPKVLQSAISDFEACLRMAAAKAVVDDRYKVPTTTDRTQFNTRLSSWSAGDRETYRVAASELHRDALNLCTPQSVAELRKLFEMTTVTKKLRRLARLNIPDLMIAKRVNRPNWIALTFMDYIEPALYRLTREKLDESREGSKTYRMDAIARAVAYIDNLEHNLGGLEVRMVSFGPDPENIITPDLLEMAAL